MAQKETIIYPKSKEADQIDKVTLQHQVKPRILPFEWI